MVNLRGMYAASNVNGTQLISEWVVYYTQGLESFGGVRSDTWNVGKKEENSHVEIVTTVARG